MNLNKAKAVRKWVMGSMERGNSQNVYGNIIEGTGESERRVEARDERDEEMKEVAQMQ